MPADRLGHGYAAINDSSVLDLLVSSQIPVEACPKSAHTEKVFEALSIYKKRGVNFGINTDDPSDIFENCSLESVEKLLQDEASYTKQDIDDAYGRAKSSIFGDLPAEKH